MKSKLITSKTSTLSLERTSEAKDLAYIFNEYPLDTRVYVEFDIPREIFSGDLADLMRVINEHIGIYGCCSYKFLYVEDGSEE